MSRKQKMLHYLYKTTCLITGRYYIGMHSTHKLEDGYMGSGKRLRYSLRKHGVDNHVKEILEFFETRELLVEAEKKAITSDMIIDNNCMNLREGGYGGGGIWSEQHKEKFIKAGIDNFNNTKDIRMVNLLKVKSTTSYRTNMSNGKKKYFQTHDGTFLGKQHSEESKQKISNQKKGTGIGKTNSQFGTCWITKNNVNKKIKKEDLDLYISDGWIKGRK